MPTKTIGLRQDVYEQLKARKRDDESFTDLVDRLLAETTPDWREGFGTLPEDDAAELDALASELREYAGSGLAARSGNALERTSEAGNDDETA